MKILICGLLLISITGCAIGGVGYSGPKRGIQGQLSTKWGDFSGVSTSYLTETELPMQGTVEPDGTRTNMVSTFKSRPDGSVEVTGNAADLYAWGVVCLRIPNACGAIASPPFGG